MFMLCLLTYHNLTDKLQGTHLKLGGNFFKLTIILAYKIYKCNTNYIRSINNSLIWKIKYIKI